MMQRTTWRCTISKPKTPLGAKLLMYPKRLKRMKGMKKSTSPQIQNNYRQQNNRSRIKMESINNKLVKRKTISYNNAETTTKKIKLQGGWASTSAFFMIAIMSHVLLSGLIGSSLSSKYCS